MGDKATHVHAAQRAAGERCLYSVSDCRCWLFVGCQRLSCLGGTGLLAAVALR